MPKQNRCQRRPAQCHREMRSYTQAQQHPGRGSPPGPPAACCLLGPRADRRVERAPQQQAGKRVHLRDDRVRPDQRRQPVEGQYRRSRRCLRQRQRRAGAWTQPGGQQTQWNQRPGRRQRCQDVQPQRQVTQRDGPNRQSQQHQRGVAGRMRHAAHGHGGNQVAAVDPRAGPHHSRRQRQQVGGQHASGRAQPHGGARVAVGYSRHRERAPRSTRSAPKHPTQARQVRAGRLALPAARSRQTW